MLSLLALLFAGCPETVEECGVQRPVPDTTVYEWVKPTGGGVCARDPDGFIHCWGEAKNCEMTDVAFRSFDASSHAACGITAGGEIRCWGWGGWPEPPAQADLVPEDGGYDQVAMSLWGACWLREGDAPDCVPAPFCEESDDDEAAACEEPPGTTFAWIAGAGPQAYCGVSGAGELSCWGRTPPFQGTEFPPVIHFDGGISGACAVGDDGGVRCSWRPDDPFEGPRPFTRVATGTHVLMLDAEGRLTDEHDEYDGDFVNTCFLGEGPYAAVGAGGELSCAVPPEGGLRCWMEWDGTCPEAAVTEFDWDEPWTMLE